MRELPNDWLSRPATESTRRWALALLDESELAAGRLENPKDAEALHDFRVAVRRLRSCLKLMPEELGKAAGKRSRRALGELVRGTNEGRDAEVALAWLEEQQGKLRGKAAPGLAWFESHLKARRDDAYARTRHDASSEIGSLARRMRKRLQRYDVELDGHERPMSEALALAVGAIGREVGSKLAEVRTLADAKAAHEARIACKRLRYALEPVRSFVPDSAELVETLRGLQDLLGHFNDMHVLAEEVRDALELAAAGRARKLHRAALREDPGGRGLRKELKRDERDGLLEIARLVQQRQNELFVELANDWLGGGTAVLVAQVDALATELQRAGAPSVEIERKFLLSRVPAEATKHPWVEIAQGWLPGEKLRERLRRTKHEDGREAYTRTIKLGSGVRRIEVEEETSRELFTKLWPLTKDRRITKRRYRVSHEGYVWEVDVFRDRDLCLAEVELANEAAEPAPPAWLAQVIVREVTGEPEYVNANLAR